MKGERGCLVGTDVMCFACASLMNMPVCTFSLAHFAFLLADLTSYFSLSLSNAYLLFPFPLKHNKKNGEFRTEQASHAPQHTATQPSSHPVLLILMQASKPMPLTLSCYLTAFGGGEQSKQTTGIWHPGQPRGC